MTPEMHLAIANAASDDAPLPVRYEAAKAALAECVSVDECSTWAKKTAAIASYARQSNDKSLEQMAMRIRARAIRRCGELLRGIPAPVGGYSPTRRSERAQAAAAAGLSRDQAKDAVRVAKIPEQDFEDAVESNEPPTIEALARRGGQHDPLINIEGRDAKEYSRSLMINGALRDLVETIGETTAPEHVRGCVPRHYPEMRADCARALAWLTELRSVLEDVE